jgi:hypothetical protein
MLGDEGVENFLAQLVMRRSVPASPACIKRV